MRLSKHFSLEELTQSDTAVRLDIDNTPSEEVMDNLKFLAEKLEDVRVLLRNPMLVSSGFRSLILNAHLGSRDTSSHVKGLAVDFISPSFGSPEAIVKAIVESDIQYDQVIIEFNRWVHLSFAKENPRLQALIIDKKGVRVYSNN